MASSDSSKTKGEHNPRKKRAFRTTDDLELLRIIMDENPLLRQRVLKTIVNQLGKQRLAASRPPQEEK
jgi:hypothetical protein